MKIFDSVVKLSGFLTYRRIGYIFQVGSIEKWQNGPLPQLTSVPNCELQFLPTDCEQLDFKIHTYTWLEVLYMYHMSYLTHQSDWNTCTDWSKLKIRTVNGKWFIVSLCRQYLVITYLYLNLLAPFGVSNEDIQQIPHPHNRVIEIHIQTFLKVSTIEIHKVKKFYELGASWVSNIQMWGDLGRHSSDPYCIYIYLNSHIVTHILERNLRPFIYHVM